MLEISRRIDKLEWVALVFAVIAIILLLVGFFVGASIALCIAILVIVFFTVGTWGVVAVLKRKAGRGIIPDIVVVAIWLATLAVNSLILATLL